MPRRHLKPVARAALYSALLALVALVAFALHVPNSSVLADDDARSKWQGRTVVLLPHAQPRIGSRLVDLNKFLSPGCQVEHVQGDFLWLGNAWVQTSEVVPVEKAEEYFTQYLQAHPDSAIAYRARAAARCHVTDDFDAAMADAQEALRLAPNDPLNLSLRSYLYWQNKDWDKAKADIEASLILDPQRALSYFSRGYVTWKSEQDARAALIDFEKATELDPRCDLAWLIRASVHFDLKNWDECAPAVEQLLTIDPYRAEAYALRAGLLACRPKRDLMAAHVAAERAIGLTPEDGQAHRICGLVYGKQGKHDSALSEFDKAIALDPQDAAAYLLRSCYRMKNEQYEEALADIGQSLKLNPSHHESWYERALILAKIEEQKPEDIQDWSHVIRDTTEALRLKDSLLALQARARDVRDTNSDSDSSDSFSRASSFRLRGIAYFYQANYDAAIADLSRAIELRPDYADALFWRAQAHESFGSTLLALDDYKRAVELSAANATYHFYLGRLLTNSKDCAAAVGSFDKAARITPNDAAIYFWRGCAHTGLGARDRALADFEHAIELEPGMASAHLAIVRNLELALRASEAVAAAERAVEFAPTCAELHRECGELYGKAHQYERAVEALNKAIAIESHDAFSFTLRGHAYFWLKQYDSASDDLNQAIILDPNFHENWYWRAFVRFHRKDEAASDKRWQSVLSDLDQAIRLKPDYAPSLALYAYAECRRGNPARAIDYLSQSLAIDPNDPEVVHYRGYLHESSGELKLAGIDYLRALQLNPQNDEYLDDAMRTLSACKDLASAVTFANEQLAQLPIEADVDFGNAICWHIVTNDPAMIAPIQWAARMLRRESALVGTIAFLHAAKGDWERSIEAIDEGIRVAPHFGELLFLRAIINYNAGYRQRALSDCMMICQSRSECLEHALMFAAIIGCVTPSSDFAKLDFSAKTFASLTENSPHLPIEALECILASAYAGNGFYEMAIYWQLRAVATMDEVNDDPTRQEAAEWLMLYSLGIPARLPNLDSIAREFTSVFQAGLADTFSPEQGAAAAEVDGTGASESAQQSDGSTLHR